MDVSVSPVTILLVFVIPVAAGSALLRCGQADRGFGTLRVVVDWSDAAGRFIPQAATVVEVSVSAADIDPPITAQIARPNNSVDLRVPSGTGRNVACQAKDGAGTVLAQATVVTDVVLNAVTTVAVTLVPPVRAVNQSTETQCAEEDNVNVPVSGAVASFVVEATHPTYPVGTDNCAPDFTNCPPSQDPSYSFTPGVFALFDDGETVVEAVREASWWRPNGMAVSVDDGDSVAEIHYVRVYRKIADANEWPQFFVLYMDGNLRLIPHPPVGVPSVCFGSSVIIGAAPIASRPIAEVASVRYVSTAKTLEVTYQAGGSATLDLNDVNRTIARVRVTVHYPTDTAPFATFRSMFVADGNGDVDHVMWEEASGPVHDDPIMAFQGGEGIDWFFYRRTRSIHDTSAPDIRLRLEW